MSNQPPSVTGSSPAVTPTGKTNIEAELEELRRQQISKSNAEKLDSAPTAPINMQDWQMQQRALKEKDRLKKTDAEAILHNYRGKDEAKSQLSSIKQEDRKGKQDAERFLHGYRAGVGDIKTPPRKQKTPTGVSIPGAETTSETGLEGVSVTDLAANYNHSGQMEDDQLANGTGKSVGIPPPLVEEPKDPSSPGGSSESGIMVESPVQPEVPASIDANVNPPSEGWVAVETSDAPAEAVAEAAASVVPVQGSDYLQDSAYSEQTGQVETLPHDAVAPIPPPSEPVQVDVEFSFGLLFSDFIPNVDKYMDATAEIVASIPSAVYDPAFPPYVRDVQEDLSFIPPPALTGAKKCVVRATVAVFVMPEYDAEQPRSQVWTTLRSAIDDGSFLHIAKRH